MFVLCIFNRMGTNFGFVILDALIVSDYVSRLFQTCLRHYCKINIYAQKIENADNTGETFTGSLPILQGLSEDDAARLVWHRPAAPGQVYDACPQVLCAHALLLPAARMVSSWAFGPPLPKCIRKSESQASDLKTHRVCPH